MKQTWQISICFISSWLRFCKSSTIDALSSAIWTVRSASSNAASLDFVSLSRARLSSCSFAICKKMAIHIKKFYKIHYSSNNTMQNEQTTLRISRTVIYITFSAISYDQVLRVHCQKIKTHINNTFLDNIGRPCKRQWNNTSWRASFNSASRGARIASIGGISSSFWAACTRRSVASAANWAASAAFFSSFIFFASRFYIIVVTTEPTSIIS